VLETSQKMWIGFIRCCFFERKRNPTETLVAQALSNASRRLQSGNADTLRACARHRGESCVRDSDQFVLRDRHSEDEE
jgi:hypothetical protein